MIRVGLLLLLLLPVGCHAQKRHAREPAGESPGEGGGCWPKCVQPHWSNAHIGRVLEDIDEVCDEDILVDSKLVDLFVTFVRSTGSIDMDPLGCEAALNLLAHTTGMKLLGPVSSNTPARQAWLFGAGNEDATYVTPTHLWQTSAKKDALDPSLLGDPRTDAARGNGCEVVRWSMASRSLFKVSGVVREQRVELVIKNSSPSQSFCTANSFVAILQDGSSVRGQAGLSGGSTDYLEPGETATVVITFSDLHDWIANVRAR